MHRSRGKSKKCSMRRKTPQKRINATKKAFYMNVKLNIKLYVDSEWVKIKNDRTAVTVFREEDLLKGNSASDS